MQERLHKKAKQQEHHAKVSTAVLELTDDAEVAPLYSLNLHFLNPSCQITRDKLIQTRGYLCSGCYPNQHKPATAQAMQLQASRAKCEKM